MGLLAHTVCIHSVEGMAMRDSKTYSISRRAEITWTEECRADSYEDALAQAREEDEKNFTRRFKEDVIVLDDWEPPTITGVFTL